MYSTCVSNGHCKVEQVGNIKNIFEIRMLCDCIDCIEFCLCVVRCAILEIKKGLEEKS